MSRGPAGKHRRAEEPRARTILERIDTDNDDRGRLSFRAADQVADLGGQLAERVLALDQLAAGRRL